MVPHCQWSGSAVRVSNLARTACHRRKKRMNSEETPPARGRPRTITRERLADAGIEMGLPDLTIVGVAKRLGVSQMALYKRIENLAALKCLVAEEIFERWPLPETHGKGCENLEGYLAAFSESMWRLIGAHPGLAPFLLRRDTITPPMMAKIDAHQVHVANAYGISRSRSHWLLFTIAYHCVALADTVREDAQSITALSGDKLAGTKGLDAIDAEHALGVRASSRGH